jgi:hypothetical protein
MDVEAGIWVSRLGLERIAKTTAECNAAFGSIADCGFQIADCRLKASFETVM